MDQKQAIRRILRAAKDLQEEYGTDMGPEYGHYDPELNEAIALTEANLDEDERIEALLRVLDGENPAWVYQGEVSSFLLKGRQHKQWLVEQKEKHS